MEPKDKAKDLINKFSNAAFPALEDFAQLMAAHACALIAVDEILKTPYIDLNDIEWWNNVKEEINKL